MEGRECWMRMVTGESCGIRVASPHYQLTVRVMMGWEEPLSTPF